MISTLAPSARQNARSFSTAAGSVPSGGVRMHQRLMNSSAKPASGPECSVPATGCAGTKCTPAGRCGAMSRTTAPLTEPTSETIAPGLRCGAISCGDRAAGADRDAEDDEIGAGDRGGVGFDHAVGDAEFDDARAGRGGARGRDDFAHRALRARRARDRDADQAEADQREAVEQRSGRVTASRRFAMKSRERVDHQPVGLLGADASCAARAAAVVLRAPQDQPARGQEGVRLLGGLALRRAENGSARNWRRSASP